MTATEFNNKIKGVFKPLKRKFYFGRHKFYTPYFTPWNFNENIITIRKVGNEPMVRRLKTFTVGNYWVGLGWPFKIQTVHVGWKDKFNTPRFEWMPSFQVWFFKWQFVIYWDVPVEGRVAEDEYFEQALWYLFYYEEYGSDEPKIELAEKEWGWRDSEGNSTWNKKYLL